MRTAVFSTIALFVVLFAATSTMADIPSPTKNGPPRPTPGYDQDVAKFTIVTSDSVRNPQLQIPRYMADDLVVGSTGSGSSSISQTQTLAAGGALSLAMVFAGIWFARSRRRATAQIAAAATVAGIAVCAAAFAFGNAAPPHARTIDPGTLGQALQRSGELTGYVELVLVDDATEIRLVLPPSSIHEKD